MEEVVLTLLGSDASWHRAFMMPAAMEEGEVGEHLRDDYQQPFHRHCPFQH